LNETNAPSVRFLSKNKPAISEAFSSPNLKQLLYTNTIKKLDIHIVDSGFIFVQFIFLPVFARTLS